jgi:hypothetical protein
VTLATLVYLLCFATSLTCAGLLLRAFRRSRSRLLLWTAVGFCALTLNNLLLVIDLVIWAGVDLWGLRQAAGGLAIVILLYGFLWEVDR